jgi:uncharacterized protein
MPESRKVQVHLDPRSPLVIKTHELGRRPGAMRYLSRPVPAPAGLALELVRVPEGAELELDLRLEAVMEGVLVSGAVTAPVEGECARCLRPVADEVLVDLQELYVYEDQPVADEDTEEAAGRLEGDLIDLEPVVRDAVVLELPLSPLCREDCPGLCPVCGARWDELPADHLHEQRDPRWDALRKLSDELSNESQER